MLPRLSGFVTIGSVSYLVLSIVFFLFCKAIGHNTMEMLYGDSAAAVLAAATGVLYSWLSAASTTE